MDAHGDVVDFDSMFVFEWDFELPPALISFVRLLTLPQEDWERTREKGKVPKAKVDVGVLGVVGEVLGRRIGLYPTSIQVRIDYNSSDVRKCGVDCVLIV